MLIHPPSRIDTSSGGREMENFDLSLTGDQTFHLSLRGSGSKLTGVAGEISRLRGVTSRASRSRQQGWCLGEAKPYL